MVKIKKSNIYVSIKKTHDLMNRSVDLLDKLEMPLNPNMYKFGQLCNICSQLSPFIFAHPFMISSLSEMAHLPFAKHVSPSSVTYSK